MKNKGLPIRLSIVFICLTIGVIRTNAQIITTYAGSDSVGYAGNNGPATAARLDNPYGVVVDTAGNIYFSETTNNCIRKVTTAGVISTIAGNDTAGYTGDNGPATAAKLNDPQSMGIDAIGNIYFADMDNNVVRQIDTGGKIHTVVGTGARGYSGDGGAAVSASLNNPVIFVRASGEIVIADVNNYRIRVVNTSGVISTIYGTGVSGYSSDNTLASAAKMNPVNVTVDQYGNIFYIDAISSVYHVIRKITVSTGAITTFQTTWAESFVFGPDGDLYFSDLSCFVRRVGPFENMSIYAGNSTCTYSGDGGLATAAGLQTPIGLAFDAYANLYIAEYNDGRIRQETYLPTTGVNTITEPSDVIKVFPNPATETFEVEMPYTTGSVSIVVSDVTGRTITTRSVQAGTAGLKEEFDVSKFPPGAYFIAAYTADKTYREKVLVR